MEEQNMFLWIKAAVTALCAAFSAAFGWLGWLVLAWAVCMVIDWISDSAHRCAHGCGILGNTAKLGKNVPYQHHRQNQHGVLYAQYGQVFHRHAQHAVGHGGYNHYNHHPGLVPDACARHSA